MRKIAIARHALERFKALAPADQERAAAAIERLRTAREVPVRMLATERAPQICAMPADDLVVVFRQLRDQLVVLSIFKHAPSEHRRK